MASSLAFYTSISLAPLLILFVSFSSRMNLDFRESFLAQIEELIGPQGAQIFAIILRNAGERADLSALAGLLSTAIMLVTSSLVFGELRSSLNEIFETRASDTHCASPTTVGGQILCFLRDNLLHVGIVLSFLAIVIASLIVSSFLSSEFYIEEKRLAYWFNIVASLIGYTGLFTLLFHYLPQRRVSWRLSFRGALGTAFWFLVGKELIGFYLGHSGFSSAYGAAGSLIVFSSWIYYSSMIILIGAEMISLRHKIRLGHHVS